MCFLDFYIYIVVFCVKMKGENMNQYPKENREYKSSLFCKIFQKQKDLLDLYNAVNGTEYADPNDLEINTLENVVYLSMKNDVSFLIDGNLNLYEHQSTYNPNMPLRGLLYFAQLYNKYVDDNNINLYGTRLQKIPLPKYVVFYNGKRTEPAEQILKLSDAFENSEKAGSLECEARMLNINYGHNQELMEKCKKLEEYSIFVSRVRKYAEQDSQNIKKAISRAVDECVKENILKDILTSQKAEVLELVLTTFNRELYEKALREEAIEDGREEGLQQGLQQGKRQYLVDKVKLKLAKGKSIESISDELEESVAAINEIVNELNRCD